MVKINELRAAIARQGMTQEQVAAAVGISSRTLYNKMKKGVFLTDEIEKLIEILKIENPVEIFFAAK